MMEVVPGIRLLKVPIPDNLLEYVNAYLIEKVRHRVRGGLTLFSACR